MIAQKTVSSHNKFSKFQPIFKIRTVYETDNDENRQEILWENTHLYFLFLCVSCWSGLSWFCWFLRISDDTNDLSVDRLNENRFLKYLCGFGWNFFIYYWEKMYTIFTITQPLGKVYFKVHFITKCKKTKWSWKTSKNQLKSLDFFHEHNVLLVLDGISSFFVDPSPLGTQKLVNYSKFERILKNTWKDALGSFKKIPLCSQNQPIQSNK